MSRMLRKVRHIQTNLPRGGVLVFLTRRPAGCVCQVVRWPAGGRGCYLTLLDDRRQRQVFRAFGDRRKIVAAANVAETSGTTPGTIYVVGSGRAKEKVYRGGEIGAILSRRFAFSGYLWRALSGGQAGLAGQRLLIAIDSIRTRAAAKEMYNLRRS